MPSAARARRHRPSRAAQAATACYPTSRPGAACLTAFRLWPRGRTTPAAGAGHRRPRARPDRPASQAVRASILNFHQQSIIYLNLPFQWCFFLTLLDESPVNQLSIFFSGFDEKSALSHLGPLALAPLGGATQVGGGGSGISNALTTLLLR